MTNAVLLIMTALATGLAAFIKKEAGRFRGDLKGTALKPFMSRFSRLLFQSRNTSVLFVAAFLASSWWPSTSRSFS